MKYWGGLIVFGVSVASALVSEALAWLLIYRTNAYKSLTESISKNSKKVETLKASGSAGSLSSAGSSSGDSGSKSKSKKIDKIKSRMRGETQSLSAIKLQSGFLTTASVIIVLVLVNSLFDGVVVAKIPFEPYPFFQKLTHRNLPGTDVTDASVAFIFMLCSLGIRPNLQKLLGFSPPRGTVPSSEAAAREFFGIQQDK